MDKPGNLINLSTQVNYIKLDALFTVQLFGKRVWNTSRLLINVKRGLVVQVNWRELNFRQLKSSRVLVFNIKCNKWIWFLKCKEWIKSNNEIVLSRHFIGELYINYTGILPLIINIDHSADVCHVIPLSLRAASRLSGINLELELLGNGNHNSLTNDPIDQIFS